jgi:hypothetical protein
MAAGTCRTCDAVLNLALGGMSELLADATQGCLKDSDCSLTRAETRCYGTCPVSILTVHASAVAAAVQSLDDALCTSFRKQCPYMTPGCARSQAFCDVATGKCKSRDIASAAAVEVAAGDPLGGGPSLGVGVQRDKLTTVSNGNVAVATSPIATPNLANVDYVISNVPLPANAPNPVDAANAAGITSSNELLPTAAATHGPAPPGAPSAGAPPAGLPSMPLPAAPTGAPAAPTGAPAAPTGAPPAPPAPTAPPAPPML